MREDRTMHIERRVLSLVTKQDGTPPAALTRATRFVDDLNFDSLDVTEFTMALEEEFEMSVPDADAAKLQTVGDVIDYVGERTKDAATPA